MVLRTWHEIRGVSIKEKLQNNKIECLNSYIEYNIAKRKEAKAAGDMLGDIFFILMNNLFCVKTMYIMEYMEPVSKLIHLTNTHTNEKVGANRLWG